MTWNSPCEDYRIKGRDRLKTMTLDAAELLTRRLFKSPRLRKFQCATTNHTAHGIHVLAGMPIAQLIFELFDEPVERGYSPPRRSIAWQSGAYRRAEKTARVQGRHREGEAGQAIGDEP